MKYKKIIALALISLVVLTTSTAFAKKSDLPEYILEQLHNDITYTVITERNLEKIDDILGKAGEKHFIVVQVPAADFTGTAAEKLMNWVEAGGRLWFQDSNLAEHFGMKNSPLKKDTFQGQPHNGDYGTRRLPGMNTHAHVYPFAEHPVVTGVQTVQAFLLEVGESQYSAVDEKHNGTIPLLRANIDPKAIAAVRPHGKGWVIFKPLLWPDVLGGERFQTNLFEFSGGYPVPKGEKPIISPDAFKGKPVKLERYDNLLLSDGQQVIGMILNRNLEFMGSEGKVTKAVEEINGVKLSPVIHELILKDGSTHTGTLMNMELNFRTPTGKTVKLSKQDIVSIDFNIGSGTDSKGK